MKNTKNTENLRMSGLDSIKTAFIIWKYIMITDLDTLNQRYNGLNAFDDFYILLNHK